MTKSLFDKLASQEDDFLRSLFLSPVIWNQSIKVRIAGIILSLNVQRPKDFQGWGVFRPRSYKTAVKVRDVSLQERQDYLDLFPSLHLIICRCDDGMCWGIPAHLSDKRFRIDGIIPIYLAEEVQLFDLVMVRFDGSLCWFDSVFTRTNWRTAAYLREELLKETPPDKLSLSGLTKEHCGAYAIAYNDVVESRRNRTEERIKQAVEHAGGKYRGYIERGNTYSIEFAVNQEIHRSVVDKNTLQVQTAGICLSNTDARFDMASLVGVIIEGQNRGRIVRTAPL